MLILPTATRLKLTHFTLNQSLKIGPNKTFVKNSIVTLQLQIPDPHLKLLVINLKEPSYATVDSSNRTTFAILLGTVNFSYSLITANNSTSKIWAGPISFLKNITFRSNDRHITVRQNSISLDPVSFNTVKPLKPINPPSDHPFKPFHDQLLLAIPGNLRIML